MKLSEMVALAKKLGPMRDTRVAVWFRGAPLDVGKVELAKTDAVGLTTGREMVEDVLLLHVK